MTSGFVIGLILLAIALMVSHHRGWISDRSFVALGVVAAILSVLLAVRQDLRAGKTADSFQEQERNRPSAVPRNQPQAPVLPQQPFDTAGPKNPTAVVATEPPVTSQPEYPEGDPRFSQKSSTIELAVRSCVRGEKIMCRLILQNTGTDRRIKLERCNFGGVSCTFTRIIDNSGSEFTLDYLRIANKEHSSEVGIYAVQGVPVPVQLTFGSGAGESQIIKLLEIVGYDSEMRGDLFFRFRDLPLLPS